ncbi:cadherin 87A isoform X1 [Tachypleus tridentatus]|uniref:cadherin 87A isoform X1 n=1 Tax=Tachypleus tridentatus TaxID=6853 RepID=UPI003FD0F3EF
MWVEAKNLVLLGILCSFIIKGFNCNLPPEFVNNIDLAVINENTPVGTSVYQLIGKDPENSAIYYGLEGTDQLSVNRNTGIVSVAAPIDRERNDTLKFFVTLEDVVGGGNDNNVVKVPVTVFILDENDNVPRFEQVPYETLVMEDTPTGTTVFNRINVTDTDIVGKVLNVKCTFHLQFPKACRKFSVYTWNESPKNVLASLVLREPLDYAQREVYQIKLVADDGQFNSTTAVIVTVGDVQNQPPVFKGSLTGIVNEDDPVDTLVMKLKASDGDKGNPREIMYELISNPEEFFVLNPVSGELRTARPLDKEVFSDTNGVITILVKAYEMEDGIQLDTPTTSTLKNLTITIRDVNDEAPKFDKISYTVNVSENVPNGTPLPNLDMFVQDTDVGSNSVFNIKLIDDSDIFSVEPPLATGSTSISIRVANGPLDYENPNQRKYILLVVAEEAFTNPRLSSTASVTVNIMDTNDNIPQFEHERYTASVMEDASPGTIVTTIFATDRDKGSYGEAGIVYSLFGNGAERFYVNPTSGVITVAPCVTPGSGNCLDFETRPSYLLSYQATDNNGLGQVAVVPLTVNVADANDNPPVFLHDVYTAIIDEGEIVFNPPLKVKALDADVTSLPSYSIISGNNLKLFSINNHTGEILVSNPAGLDVSALRTDLIILTVQASDGGKGIDTAVVKITVRDANNNSPIFDESSYVASVLESSTPGITVEQVAATDLDTGANAQLSYRIQKGGFDDFVIGTDTGIVSVAPNAQLDYERRSKYIVEIVAIDSGSPSRSGTTTLTVQILNSNNKNPYFTPTTQRAQVSEGAEVNEIFYRLKAKDPDTTSPESLRFSVIEPITALNKDGKQVDETATFYRDIFKVEQATGDVQVARKLNREAVAIVTLTVVVTDISATPPQTGKGTLVITVVDFNDFPPAFARPWTPEHPEITIKVMEEQPVGSVVATFVASDPDSNIARYELKSDNDHFALDNSSGILTIKKRVDFEQVQQFVFSIIAYDTGVPQLSSVAKVTADVVNINDNDPIFSQQSYKAELKENAAEGTFVITINATDADAGDFGKIQYSLIGERSSDFTVDNQGVIRVAAAAMLDREETPMITLQVQATDQGHDLNSYRSISVPIYISLKDVNDNPPVFTQRNYRASIVTNIPLDHPSPIIQVTALDKDEGHNAEVSYTIVAGNENGQFAINEEKGSIYPAQPFEETLKNYLLRVQARDQNGRGTNYDETTVTIEIVEVNQDKPRFLVPASLNATVEIPENQSISDYLVMTVKAVDTDKEENGRISYWLKLGDKNVEETEEFFIDHVTGELKTKKILDREKKPKYELVLAAKDHGSPMPFETLQFLTIVLKDVDDNIPQFTRTQSTNPYVFNINENAPLGTPVGQLHATDADVGDNAHIYYYIIDGNYNGFFTIDKLHGVIRSNVSFDRENKTDFELIVKVTSNPDYTILKQSQQNGLSPVDRSYREEDLTLAWIQVIVADINDNVPYFTNDPYFAGIKYTAQVGDVVATVTAVDADQGPNGTLTYRLEQINLFRLGVPGSVRPIPSPFNISKDGRISTTQLMTQYNQVHFKIVVAAREDAFPHRVTRATVKLWVYEPEQLTRVIIAQPPEIVNKKKEEFISILSNATGGFVVIDDIRYHVNADNNLVQKWTDLYIHVANEDGKMISIPEVIEAVDTNARLFEAQSKSLQIHKVVPAYVGIEEEQFDLSLAVLIALLVVLFVGIITVIVCCMCLKSWYAVKIKEALIHNDEIQEPGNTTENPLWTEQKLKLYEEQELSMSVAPDQEHVIVTEAAISFGDDTASAMYATLRRSNAGSIGSVSNRGGATLDRSTTNEYATLNNHSNGSEQPVSDQKSASNTLRRQRQREPDHHEYHELQTPVPPAVINDTYDTSNFHQGSSSPEPSSSLQEPSEVRQSSLTIGKDGEPVLIAELL